jgi:hypothetical protein
MENLLNIARKQHIIKKSLELNNEHQFMYAIMVGSGILWRKREDVRIMGRITLYIMSIFLIVVILSARQSTERNSSNLFQMGNAFLLDTTIMYTQARGNQSLPSIAYDGTNYLVVWQDSRCHPQHDVYCARVDSQGSILDPAGIHIATVTYDNMQYYCEGTPAVAYNGTEYIVVYQHRRNSADTDIYGTRVTTSGVILDPDGIPISTSVGYQRFPSVAATGTDFLVVWEDHRSGTPDIYGARVNEAGIVLDSSGIEICSALRGQRLPSLTCDGLHCLVVWQDARDSTINQYDIYGARVDTSGVLLDTNGIAIVVDAAQQIEPSISYDGTNYFVVWEDRRTQARCISGTRVDTAGTVLDPGGIAISGMPNLQEWTPSITFNGTEYFVVWADDRNGTYPDIYGARVDQKGTVLDTSNIPLSLTPGQKGLPAVASNGNDFLAAWDDDRDYPAGDVYGARVNATGAILDPQGIDITTAAVFHENPGIGYCGSNFFIAWGDYRLGLYSSDIYGARADTLGNLLDSPSFMLCTAPFGQYSPSIAYDGTNYCAVWTHNIGGAWAVKGTRVSPAGIVLDPGYINISAEGNALSPQIASCSGNFLTTWVDYRNSYTSPDIYCARIGTNGSVLDPTGIAISALDGLEYMPSVGFGGTYYLLAWEDTRNGLYDIYCARVNTNGTLIDPSGIAVTTADSLQRNSTITFDGTNFFIVWQDKRNGSYDIYGARIGQNGVVLDPSAIALSIAPNDQINPSVAFDGSYYVVVWEDYREVPCDVYGALVDTSGSVIDSFITTAQPGPQCYPEIAHGTNGQMLITYCGWTDSINTHPANAMRTWAVFYPSTGIKEDAELGIEDTHFDLTVHPNPFSRYTNIRFMIHDPRYTEGELHNANFEMRKPTLEIYDAAGRLVKSFRIMPYALRSSLSWDGRDDQNRILGSGVYFVELRVNDYRTSEKVLLVR